MDNGMIAAGIGLLSAIIGGIIGAISAQSIVQRRIQMENVTQERAKWRARIRALVPEVHDWIVKEDKSVTEDRTLKLQKYQNIFRTLLNPNDPKDNKIIKVIDRACKHPENAQKLAEKFGRRVSLLLKHDWERAKEEVKHPLLRGCEPKRLTLEQSENPTLLEPEPWWRKYHCQICRYCFTAFFIIPVIIVYIRIIAWLVNVLFLKSYIQLSNAISG